MEGPAKHMSPNWTEMYRLELGIDPSDRHQLLTAVTKNLRMTIEVMPPPGVGWPRITVRSGHLRGRSQIGSESH